TCTSASTSRAASSSTPTGPAAAGPPRRRRTSSEGLRIVEPPGATHDTQEDGSANVHADREILHRDRRPVRQAGPGSASGCAAGGEGGRHRGARLEQV